MGYLGPFCGKKSKIEEQKCKAGLEEAFSARLKNSPVALKLLKFVKF